MKKRIIVCSALSIAALLAFRFWSPGETNLVIDVSKLSNRLEATPNFAVKPTRSAGMIDWEQFPEFHLPSQWKVVYDGVRFAGYDYKCSFKHGFSHLNFNKMKFSEAPKIPQNQRAWLITANFLTDQGSKFAINEKQIFDPFEDNEQLLSKMKGIWGLCDIFKDCDKNPTKLPLDILCWDLENVPDAPSRKNLAPNSAGQKYNNAELIPAYMQAMSAKYYFLLQSTKTLLKPGAMVSSCCPGSPIMNQFLSFGREKAYYDPGRKSWLWNFPAADGKFQQEQMDFIMPSYYVFYGTANSRNEMYSFLYDVETNAKWTNLPEIPLVWMFQTDEPKTPVRPPAAEGYAIFNFMMGAKGIWFWDITSFIQPNQGDWGTRNYACYEYFLAGLYRLSQHSDVFAGNYQAIIPEVSYDGGRTFQQYNAVDLSIKSLPIVRAVLGNGKILVAAQAPKAQSNQQTQLVVRVGKWQDVITLSGEEVYLGKATL